VYLCPVSVDRQEDVDRSHILSVLSQEAVTRMLGSLGLKARQLTSCECPLSVDSHVPVSTFQSLIVLSQLPVASLVPSGLKLTL
jgi:hypothetical protein